MVPHAGALVHGIYKRLVLLRSKFKTYVAACYSKLCAYFPKHPTISEMQTTTWGYLVEKYARMYDLPSKFAVLELRYNGFILTLNGLMVHGGHFRDATVSMLPHPFFVYTWKV